MRKEVVLGVAVLTGLMALSGRTQPAGEEVKPEVAAQVRGAVEEYVKKESELKGGFFLRGLNSGEIRDLRFDYVHDGVEPLSENQYRVCVDFLDESKKRLDVDFYLSPTPSGEFRISKIKVHRVNGVKQPEPKR